MNKFHEDLNLSKFLHQYLKIEFRVSIFITLKTETLCKSKIRPLLERICPYGHGLNYFSKSTENMSISLKKFRNCTNIEVCTLIHFFFEFCCLNKLNQEYATCGLEIVQKQYRCLGPDLI